MSKKDIALFSEQVDMIEEAPWIATSAQPSRRYFRPSRRLA